MKKYKSKGLQKAQQTLEEAVMSVLSFKPAHWSCNLPNPSCEPCAGFFIFVLGWKIAELNFKLLIWWVCVFLNMLGLRNVKPSGQPQLNP